MKTDEMVIVTVCPACGHRYPKEEKNILIKPVFCSRDCFVDFEMKSAEARIEYIMNGGMKNENN